MSTLAAGSATDRGKARATNQDDMLKARFTAPPSAEGLAEAAREASRAVWQRADTDPSLEGIGATLTAVAVLDGGDQTRLAIVNIGDSRAYLFAEGLLSQLTRDHSVVQALIDAEELTQDQWRTHPRRSLLTRALGMAPVVEPDISLPAITGTARVLVCTDGLTAQADETQLAAVLSTVPDPDQAAAELVQLANRNGGQDNTAVIVIDITPGQEAS